MLADGEGTQGGVKPTRLHWTYPCHGHSLEAVGLLPAVAAVLGLGCCIAAGLGAGRACRNAGRGEGQGAHLF